MANLLSLKKLRFNKVVVSVFWALPYCQFRITPMGIDGVINFKTHNNKEKTYIWHSTVHLKQWLWIGFVTLGPNEDS